LSAGESIAAKARPVRRWAGWLLFPGVILAVGVALSTVVASSLQSGIEEAAKARFERQADEAKQAIKNRIQSYTDVIYAVRAMFHTSRPVSRADFHRYVAELDLPRRYPALQIMNYGETVSDDAKAVFERSVRNDRSVEPAGYPSFAIRPPGRRPSYYVLKYVEPMNGNEQSFGLDITAPPFLPDALERGRDSGELVSSGRLIRYQKGVEKIAVAMRLSVYRPGQASETVEKRRAAYVGSIGTGFRLHELMQGVLDEGSLKHIRFKVFDAGSTEELETGTRSRNLLFDSSPDAVAKDVKAAPFGFASSSIEMGGRLWELEFSADRNSMLSDPDRELPWVVRLGGSLMSILLSGIFYFLSSSRRRAVVLAAEITHDLRDRESSLAEAQRMASLGGWFLRRKTGTMRWSEQLYGMLKVPQSAREPDLPMFLSMVHEDDRDLVSQSLASINSRATRAELEHRVKARDGTELWVHTMAQVASYDDEGTIRGATMDITARKRADIRLSVEHRVTQLLSAQKPVDEIMVEVMETVCRGLGWAAGAQWTLVEQTQTLSWGKSWRAPGDTALVPFLAALSTRPVELGTGVAGRAWQTRDVVVVPDLSLDPSMSQTDSVWRAKVCAAVALPIVSGQDLVGVLEFFSVNSINSEEPLWLLLKSLTSQIGQFYQRRRAEEALRFVALHDPLTHLPNRAEFSNRLRRAIKQAEIERHGVAVLFVDIDRFKMFNDSLGHSAGDLLLRECAERITSALRGSDFVARIGGDEFVVMIEKVKKTHDIVLVIEKLSAALGKSFSVDAQDYIPSASIGISSYPDDGADAEILLKHADIAMYRSKNQGRGSYQFFSPDMNANTVKRLEMEAKLRKALERKEFLLHYQPKLDLRTGRICGLEALIRWQHPDLGMVPPAEFIPLAEETGLIVPIGEWVIRAACGQARIWSARGLERAKVAINLSARQFAHKTLVSDIASVLEEKKLRADCLQVEITESLVMQDPVRTAHTLRQLKAMGIAVSIDDFGTGHSSLSYIKKFPVDILKIDKSFVEGIPGQKEDLAITAAIITMAHGLGLRVIGEGVETQTQFDSLKQLGCDEIQGYFFSKPLPAEEVTRLLLEDQGKPHLTVVESIHA
jgi:diguanylate cyclase (GGDEF)-like protein